MNDIRNDEDIQRLVESLYGRVQNNERLNHIFSDVAEVDWKHSLPKMVDYWSNLIFQPAVKTDVPEVQHPRKDKLR